MPRYCLYYLDRLGHVRQSIELTCDDDDQAMKTARGHQNGGRMELWRDEGRIAKLPHLGFGSRLHARLRDSWRRPNRDLLAHQGGHSARPAWRHLHH
jgi:hypothetical protein